jgi:flagellar export protein FliJ
MSGFRLDVVLRLRRIAEDSARSLLGQALARHLAAMAAVDELGQDVATERAQLEVLQRAASAPAGDLREAHDGVEFAERALLAATGRVEDAARALFESRAALATATRRREVVERLRDRAHETARRAADHKTEVEMAEFATVRHAWAEIEESIR